MRKTQHEREDKAASDDEGNFGPVFKLARLNGLSKGRVKEEPGSRSGIGASVAWKGMVGVKEERVGSSFPFVEEETEEEKDDEEEEDEEEDEDAYMVDQSTVSAPVSCVGYPSQDEEDDDDQVGLNLTENEDHYPFHPDPLAIPHTVSSHPPAPTPTPTDLHSIPGDTPVSCVASTLVQANTADGSNTDDNTTVHVCVSADSINDATGSATGVKGVYKEALSPILQSITKIESKIEKRGEDWTRLTNC
jgi:hypothetical protein